MGASGDVFIIADPSTSKLFASELEHRPFQFRHCLSASPLFELGALRQLVEYFHQHGLPSHFESVDPTAGGWGEGLDPDRTRAQPRARRGQELGVSGAVVTPPTASVRLAACLEERLRPASTARRALAHRCRKTP